MLAKLDNSIVRLSTNGNCISHEPSHQRDHFSVVDQSQLKDGRDGLFRQNQMQQKD